MRWLFLLLLVLNGFYYVWHQQEAPMRAKDVTPLSLYRGSQQDIRLLSESAGATAGRDKVKAADVDSNCLFIGGFARQEAVQALERRLSGLDINTRPLAPGRAGDAGYWLRVAPESRHLANDLLLQNLAKEFNELKHKIMLCEGIATVE
ncbi:hypothetical protein [Pseudomonas fluorescens]|uniref:Sporulation domain-containing protein n=1 Tax=Pseudomonas fluorescens TaxID=294 RepID=A0A5E7CGK0_PSEFL|nr:hypothetical protein [Pseudomonas fluorescens]VVO03586.1 hypothetical protein PS723_02844 [Pseudomonas fluorescens]